MQYQDLHCHKSGNLILEAVDEDDDLPEIWFPGSFDPDSFVECEYEDIDGCMDEDACNYNPYATINDGSCEYGGVDCLVSPCLNSEDPEIEGSYCVDDYCNGCCAIWYNSDGDILSVDCGDDTECINDIDDDGICEDDCQDDMVGLVIDCECEFVNPNTYTSFFTTIDEEECIEIEDCECVCYNDSDNDGVCDEDETNTSVDELLSNRLIIKVVDVLGVNLTSNKGYQLEIYDDGTVVKKYILR